jgi:hypothetical protein
VLWQEVYFAMTMVEKFLLQFCHLYFEQKLQVHVSNGLMFHYMFSHLWPNFIDVFLLISLCSISSLTVYARVVAIGMFVFASSTYPNPQTPMLFFGHVFQGVSAI